VTSIDGILDRIREHGGRVTSVRRAIVTALVEAPDHHITAEDLAARVQAADPEIHLSTIYRTLDTLEELGVVEHVHLGHGSAVYHLADNPHQHLVCEHCGAVIEVPDSIFNDLAEHIEKNYDFTIHPHHFALVGLCNLCS
jgi:Fur family transcriptional regulator, ferric uptake regulator